MAQNLLAAVAAFVRQHFPGDCARKVVVMPKEFWPLPRSFVYRQTAPRLYQGVVAQVAEVFLSKDGRADDVSPSGARVCHRQPCRKYRRLHSGHSSFSTVSATSGIPFPH